MAQRTLAEAPEASLALSWLLVVVSMVGFSALMTSAPGLAPAGAFTAPQPATSKSSNGVASDRNVRPDLRIAAPFTLRPVLALSLLSASSDGRNRGRAYGKGKDMLGDGSLL